MQKITNAKPIPHNPASVEGSDGGDAQVEAKAKESQRPSPKREARAFQSSTSRRARFGKNREPLMPICTLKHHYRSNGQQGTWRMTSVCSSRPSKRNVLSNCA